MKKRGSKAKSVQHIWYSHVNAVIITFFNTVHDPCSYYGTIYKCTLYLLPFPLIFNKNYKGLGTTEKEKKQEET